MSFRSTLLRFVFAGAPVVAVPVALVACGGRGPLDDNIAAYNTPLPTPGSTGVPEDDASIPPKEDAGKGTKDAGTGIPGLPGLPGLGDLLNPDAGGIAGCLGCAHEKCDPQGAACLEDMACVQEGLCDVGCLTGGTGTDAGAATGAGGLGGLGGALGGLNLQCFSMCGSNQKASQEFTAAATCLFTNCGTGCLSAVMSAGSGGLGALGGLGGLAGLGLGGTGTGTTVPTPLR